MVTDIQCGFFISSYGGKQRRAKLVGKYVYVLFYHTKVNG